MQLCFLPLQLQTAKAGTGVRGTECSCGAAVVAVWVSEVCLCQGMNPSFAGGKSRLSTPGLMEDVHSN